MTLSNETQYVTIGFDGRSTQCQASFLMVHATDQDVSGTICDQILRVPGNQVKFKTGEQGRLPSDTYVHVESVSRLLY